MVTTIFSMDRDIVVHENFWMKLPTDVFVYSLGYAPLQSVSAAIRTCKSFSDRYFDDSCIEKRHKSAVDRWLSANHSLIMSFSDSAYHCILARCANNLDRRVFRHVLKHENREQKKQRTEVMRFFDYSAESCFLVGDSMNAYTQRLKNNLKFKTVEALAEDELNENVLTVLLSNGFNISAQDNSDGNTALHIASLAGNTRAIRILLKNKIDVNIKNKKKQTALMLAVISQHTAIIRLLVKHKANMTFFYMSSLEDDPNSFLYGGIDTVKFFVESGHNIDEKDKDGNTLLHLAVLNSKCNRAQSLILLGADIDAKNDKGDTPLSLSYSYPAMAKILLQHKTKSTCLVS